MRYVQTTGKKLRTGDSALCGYTRRRAPLDTRLGEPERLDGRMLTTLQQGVRGGRWHTLIDKVYAPLNLFAASRDVIGNQGAAGVDHQTVEGFLATATGRTGPASRGIADEQVSAAGGETGLDRETGKHGETTAGSSHDPRPRGANRVVARAGNRPSGSEGGAAETNWPSLPLSTPPARRTAGGEAVLRQEVPVAGVDHAPRATNPTSNHTNYDLSYHQYGYKSLPAAVENHFSHR